MWVINLSLSLSLSQPSSHLKTKIMLVGKPSTASRNKLMQVVIILLSMQLQLLIELQGIKDTPFEDG
jgi:hypothetical protein